MGDPTGISGALVGYAVRKLLDEVILQTENAIYFRRYCRTLNEYLKNIQPLLQGATASLPRDYYADSVVAGPSAAVKKWLEDLEEVLKKASKLVLQCNTTSNFDVYSRNKIARNILNITKDIESVVATQAPLAALHVGEETLQAVIESNRKLDIIRDQLEFRIDARTVGDTTQIILQIEGIQPAQAFLEIRSRTDVLAASLHNASGQIPSSQQNYREDERASYTLRPVPEKTFGMDVPLAKLKDLLRSEIRDMKWVGVYGKPGVGKTLLAEQAYNSEAVQEHFQGNAFWLAVGRSPSIERLLMKLCGMLRIYVSQTIEREELKTRVFNALREKKVLLVLDDVWEDRGDPVLDWLNVTAGWDSGSKILVTTRNLPVLERKNAQDSSTVRMECLSDDDSWKLFCEFAFGGTDNVPTTLQELGKAVADECKGLPLALKVIAGAQAGQRAPEQWQRALRKLQEAEVLNKDHHVQLYDRLQLSYDSLELLEEPAHRQRLQKCFIYFASFPEDSDVDVEKLVNLWAGEKLLEGGNDTEDDTDPSVDGNYLLGMLIGRSLIELRKAKWSPDALSVRLQCRVHDVLRDLARHLIKEGRAPMDCLFKAGEGLKNFPDKWLTPIRNPLGFLGRTTQGLTSDATHLSLNDNLLESLPTKLKAPKLEVLLLAHSGRKNSKLVISPGFLESFSSLKVLDLAHTSIASFPESLKKLKNLVYLNLSYTELQRLPRGLGELPKLENLSLQACTILRPWPFDVSRLKSLSTLNTRGCGDLWNPSPIAHDSLDKLCSLRGLRNLSITGDRDHLPSSISSLVDLRYLSIYFEYLKSLPPSLYTSSGPKLSKLQHLSLDNSRALTELPSWIDSLSQLVTLNLACCNRLTNLPDLHTLQRLRKLDLGACTRLQQLPPGFTSKTAFPALKELYMQLCLGLKEFPSIEEGAFPQLTILDLSGCAFQTLPRSLSLLPELVKLNLNLCEQLKNLDDCFRLSGNESSDPTSPGTSQTHDTLPFFKKLQDLGLKGLKQLKNLPCDVAACPSLKTVDLRDTKVAIPENLRMLQAGDKVRIKT